MHTCRHTHIHTHTHTGYLTTITWLPAAMVHRHDKVNQTTDTNLLVAVKHCSIHDDFQNSRIHAWCSHPALEDR